MTNRRELCIGGLSGLFSYGCSFAQSDGANVQANGCRSLLSNADFLRRKILPGNDEMLKDYGSSLSKIFGVRPGICYYDDMTGPNALASTEALLPDGPDGTVLIGTRLFRGEIDLASRAGLDSTATAFAIIAHEYGHILQYKRDMKPSGPWQMEPHADFLAGWAFVKEDRWVTQNISLVRRKSIETTISSFFEKGDILFNDSTHHGQHEFRAAMIRAGLDSGSLNLDAAFEKGRSYAGLKF